ncbi:exosortase F system-associated protein [Aequorivita sp. SDUM287046]|uniref:Exosortase F system-associated protein n=1 Tax=Aequorivita aurantiaca TaxID=3053356 RepID=A0ABT8DGI9_9FLAO|nr:exosortase F system-associated protein [Aequorivita aurantiaca]MDN3724501.1 exosortase F system-associated protein [Aequorivita aurantiaca]
MKRPVKLGFILVCVGFLVSIRAFESDLFYDPLLDFFKMDYKFLPLPVMDQFKLFLGVAIRFLLNTFISLIIIWLVFGEKEIVKLSVFLYVVLFIILFSFFCFLIITSEGTTEHFILFYVRRFLIQPLFLLLLLPAFYFQKYKSR